MRVALVLDALTVARAGRPVLAQVTLEVPFGAVVCVEGANGSGKTSLLRVLAGLAAPAAGTVRRAVYRCVRARARAAGAAGEPARVAAGDGRAARGAPVVARRRRAVGPRACDVERPAADLSKGTLQRVVLCEALTAPVSLLVLDEPWAGLDGEGRDLLARTLRARADAGVCGDARRTIRACATDGSRPRGVAARRRPRHACMANAAEMLVVATRDGRRAEHGSPAARTTRCWPSC